MTRRPLRQLLPEQVRDGRRRAVDAETLAAASEIVADVRNRGIDAVLEYARRFGDAMDEAHLVYSRADLDAALASIDAADRGVLERTAERIKKFAESQKQCLGSLDAEVPGGRAGHTLMPLQSAACYAPGGRYPLPSSVLMTAITARVAGVNQVWVASPRPSPIVLAAAAIAGADGLIACGGAQAIAAVAYGAGDIPACDIIVGPGNRWVTAAKQIVAADVAIDMLAGPSELVVIADDSANADLLAINLLAQAEHDPDATPILIATSAKIATRVQDAIDTMLATLSTRDIAGQALSNGYFTIAESPADAARLCNTIAPEHVQVVLSQLEEVVPHLTKYGSLFVGQTTPEAFGDYGFGPNHVLPTGGTAAYAAGVSVMTFLRARTWLRIDDPAGATAAADDCRAIARMEGLAAHERSIECWQESFAPNAPS